MTYRLATFEPWHDPPAVVRPGALIPDLLLASGLLHFPQMWQRGLGPVFAAARSAGVLTALDPQFPLVDMPPPWLPHLADVLAHADVLLCDEHEARMIFGTTSLDDALDAAHASGPRIVVVKRGAAGSTVSADGRVVDQPALPMAEASVREAVGAGDAFDAGFLDSLVRGGSVTDAARAGTAAAALSLTGQGGADGIVDRAAVLDASAQRPASDAASPMIELPERPARLRDRAVAAWSEPVVIPTYPLPEPDRNPLFLEKRVYQGSSGRVYPNPVTDAVADGPVPVAWEAVHLENEHLRVMVLPAIGGRIHVVQDRHTGYDLVYRQNVIKPALVGLLGPWISGGIELNWPQHHRPSTFMPTDWAIEELEDGGAVVWCSEHEPTQRMKGMHGVTLRPGSSLLELQVRLTNRTPLVRRSCGGPTWPSASTTDYEAVLPARRALRRRPCQARDVHVPGGARPLLRRRLRVACPRPRPTCAGIATSRCPPRTWPWAAGATSSAATTMPPARATCTGPTTPSRPARSSGPGATTTSATPGTASSRTPTGRTWSSWPASSPTTSPTSASCCPAR